MCYTSAMKRIIWGIIIVLLVVGGIWFVTRGKKAPTNTSITTYNNSTVGISFSYPKIFAASTTDSTVTLHHEVAFTHHDFCDFKGEGTTTSATLTDFNVTLHTDDLGLAETMKTESPYIPAENFVNGEVIPSPGFIDIATTTNYSGFKIFEGAEGCGQTIYYLKISGNKTLVVIDDLITVFTGAIDPNVENAALAVPGAINKNNHDQILSSVLNTIKVQ